MSRRRRATTLQVARRIIAALALAGMLLPWTSGPAAPVRADDPGDPAVRLEFLVHTIIIHDDNDIGEGFMSMWVKVWEVNDGCAPDAVDKACIRVLADSYILSFASDGDSIEANVILPHSTVPEPDPSTTTENGIAMYSGRNYGFEISGEEQDYWNPNDYLGALRGVMNEQNGWGPIGFYAERAGDFTAIYEIRRKELPDLRPKALRIADVQGSQDDLVCMTVENVGPVASDMFGLTLNLNESHFAWVEAAGLRPGESREQCSAHPLPGRGRHQLALIVDEKRWVPEMDEKNNRLIQALDRGPLLELPPGVLGPDGPVLVEARADLTVSAIRVRGQQPSGNNDCDPGQNDVTLEVKNQGTAAAATFAVRLVVDDKNNEATEKSVASLDPGKEVIVQFDNVSLNPGSHKLTATADATNMVAESSEDNKLDVNVSCVNE